jgi:hypothetical protein
MVYAHMIGSAPISIASSTPLPPRAAPGILDYPDFELESAPEISGASHAWTGTIQPFSDDLSAQAFLECVESGKKIDVTEGVISARAPVTMSHWAAPLLVNMGVRFRLLILEFEGMEHPRAYGMQPEISHNVLPAHPHLRADKTLLVGHQALPALCVYSGAVFVYAAGLPRIVQFLDQTSTFLAKHLIWLRTRTLWPASFAEPRRSPFPGELILDIAPRLKTHPIATIKPAGARHWAGYWPGAIAATGAEQHVRTIRPSQECWCWSGRLYRDCHRPVEAAIVANNRKRKAAAG